METSRAELEALQERCRDHTQNVQQLLVKQEYQRSQAALRKKMLENLDDTQREGKPKVWHCGLLHVPSPCVPEVGIPSQSMWHIMYNINGCFLCELICESFFVLLEQFCCNHLFVVTVCYQ